MRAAQINSLIHLLINLKGDKFHHGDCEGGDVEGAACAIDLGYYIVCHPPISPRHRGWFKQNDETRVQYEYVVRDHHIVDESQVLIAAPHTSYEIVRSGTWTTMRYARSLKRKIYVIKPDGTIETENL